MEFPVSLWSVELEGAMVKELVDAFPHDPILLTDELANVIYINEPAEKLFDESAEALVNRLAFSLVGFGKKGVVPKSFEKALRGEESSWRGAVDLAEMPPAKYHFAHVSAILREKQFVCGVIRLSAEEASQ